MKRGSIVMRKVLLLLFIWCAAYTLHAMELLWM